MSTTRIAAVLTVLVIIGGCIAVLAGLFRGDPARADVTYSQNVVAVGMKKHVQKWTNYGPGVYWGVCGGRTGCASGFRYWRVSRGTATIRTTTFKVTESIRRFDYYLLDVDVATSSRTGSGDGGAGSFRIRSGGTTISDRNDSKSLDAKRDECSSVAVTMSTPWPFVTASTAVGHATLCDDAADLVRSYSGDDAIYRGTHLADIRHLTMQRWVQVAAGRKPSFAINVVLPSDSCARGDGDGHCIRFTGGTTTRTINVGTVG